MTLFGHDTMPVQPELVAARAALAAAEVQVLHLLGLASDTYLEVIEEAAPGLGEAERARRAAAVQLELLRRGGK